MARKLADSKLKTKEFLKSKWVPVPKTLAVLSKHEQVTLEKVIELEPPFVVKPNNWFGWKWIIVVDDVDASGNFVANTGDTYTPEQMKIHLLNVLDGFFSLSWSRDKAIIEKKIVITKEVQVLWTFWLPDVRIIVFNMVPVMAMMRIPTKESWWKANVHGGACWVWVDIWTWRLTYVTHHSKIVKSIPWIWDVRWLVLPHWDQMLEMAVRVQKETSIWYLWCDIVLDDVEWPLLLEMNIRPWLEVQVANMWRLKDRLERVEWLFVNSVEKWVRLWRDLFSWDIEEKIRNLSWKKVVGWKEYVSISYNKKNHKYIADVRPGSQLSVLDKTFAEEILQLSEKELEQKHIVLEWIILGEKKSIKFAIKEIEWAKILLWLNTLKWFLMDPFKYKKWQLPVTEWNDFEQSTNIAVKKNYHNQLYSLDKKLVSLDKKLLILRNITPTNLAEQRKIFVESEGEHIPEFIYNQLTGDFDAYKKDLKAIEIPEIPLFKIYQRKKEEMLHKINYLKAFAMEDVKDQTKYARKLYWSVNKENVEYAKLLLDNKHAVKEEDDFLEFREIQDFVKKFNHIYWINIKLKKSNKAARFVMNGDTLFFREWSVVWNKEMRSIIAHEIEWHYLRRVNGKNLEYSLFGHGTAHYLEIDEWIAIYNQNRFLKESHKKFYGIFENYILVDYALENSYSRLHEKVMDLSAYDLERAFTRISRLKRGFKKASVEWVFCKEVVYVNGLRKVEKYIEAWGELKELYLWKMSLEDLEELKESYFMKLDFSNLKIPFFL